MKSKIKDFFAGLSVAVLKLVKEERQQVTAASTYNWNEQKWSADTAGLKDIYRRLTCVKESS